MSRERAERNGHKPGAVVSARTIAASVLERVERDKAFAAAALDAELDRHPQLDRRERALAAELSYGVLRTRVALERVVKLHAPRGITDRVVLRQLLIAAYQLLLLDRIPAFAAVDEAVSAIRRARGPRVAGFANAILRRVSEGERLTLASAIRETAPAWLVERLEAAVGPSEAEGLLGIDVPFGRAAARMVGNHAEPSWFAAAETTPLTPSARLLPSGDPQQLDGYEEGAFVVQELGAQLVALALGVRSGERVLDACAGRGQKTSLFVERAAGGEVWAADSHPQKLEILAQELKRLGLPPARNAAVDWTLGTGGVPDGFDRVLVDAPCTGVGTLRRRPEIAERLTPEDPARLGELALGILRGAATRARSGGRVVFAVCSVLPEEAERVVEQVTDLLEPAPFDAPELAALASDSATSFRLLPRAHGTDGYFVASFLKR